MADIIESSPNFECPKCGSTYTRSTEDAYLQSIRTGGLIQTESGLSKKLSPPKERDEKVWPRIVMCVVFSISLICLPRALNHTGIEVLHGLSPLSVPVVVISALLGLSAGLALALPAIRHNVYVFQDRYEKWRSQAICRRCGSIFRTDMASRANAEKSQTDV